MIAEPGDPGEGKQTGVLPADRIIRMWGEICSTGLWSTEGMSIYPEDLPIGPDLRERLERWAREYDRLDDTVPEQSDLKSYRPWEARPGAPVTAFNEEGRGIACALTAALPGWEIVAYDVDGWCRPPMKPIAG